jgi:hypothetical protein
MAVESSLEDEKKTKAARNKEEAELDAAIKFSLNEASNAFGHQSAAPLQKEAASPNSHGPKKVSLQLALISNLDLLLTDGVATILCLRSTCHFGS